MQQNQKPPAKVTLQKYIRIAVNFSDLGLDAMKDVTYLNGRPKGHPDFKLYNHKRLTLKMCNRDELHQMEGPRQEVYIYRLAKQVQLPAYTLTYFNTENMIRGGILSCLLTYMSGGFASLFFSSLHTLVHFFPFSLVLS